MSRCYRIEVSETLRRHVEVEDGIAIHLELLDILPPERMRSLLEEQLGARGYTKQADGTYTKSLEGGIEVRVTEDGEVQISLSDEAELELSASGAARSYDARDQKAEDAIRRKLAQNLEGDAQRETEALREKVTKRLEDALDALRGELDDAVNRATGEALKEKARQLGEVQEISENPETGELVIRVKV